MSPMSHTNLTAMPSRTLGVVHLDLRHALKQFGPIRSLATDLHAVALVVQKPPIDAQADQSDPLAFHAPPDTQP